MFKPFSKRQSEASGSSSQPYKYDELPEALKIQAIYAWREVVHYFPAVSFKGAEGFYRGVRALLCEELGVTCLTDYPQNAEEDVCNYFVQERDVARCLNIIEIVFDYCVQIVRSDTHVHFDGMNQIRAAAEKLNARFQEHAVGYEFRDLQFIRIDSQFMHKEAVSPAMALLHEKYLAGANQEFVKAHEHFRHGRFGESINECLKAFESTMKAICHKRNWQYNQTDTAKTLLATCEKNGLFPSYMQSSLGGLRSVLENVATTRNKLSGHGQGAQQIQIAQEVAAFVIHSTGANILLLASLEKQLS
jgi:hypothetical protein